jgi:ABC-type multidrug transport system fused ATPase/permease subunit
MIYEKPLFHWVFERNRRRQVGLLTMVLATVFFRVFPLEMQKRIVNVAIPMKSLDVLLLYCGLYIGAVVLAGGLKYFINVLQGFLGQKILYEMREQLYKHLLTLPLTFFRRTPPGMVIASLTSELGSVGEFMGGALAVPVINVLSLVAFAAYMTYLNPLLAILSFAMYPIEILIIPMLQNRFNRLNQKRISITRSLSNVISEAISGMHEIHGNASFDLEHRKFAGFAESLFGLRHRMNIYRFLIKFTNNFFQSLGPFILFLVGGYFTINGRLDLGALVAFLSAYEKLYDPWKELMDYYQDFQDSRMRYRQVMDYFSQRSEFDLTPGQDRGSYELKGHIEVEDLSFVVDSQIRILDQISLNIEHGQQLALVGLSGSGKSTLAMVMGQLYNYTSGHVLIDGKELKTLSKLDVSRNCGFVPQQPFIFDGTLLENAVYGCQALIEHGRGHSEGPAIPGTKEVLEAIDQVGMAEDTLKFGLDTLLDRDRHVGVAERLVSARRTFFEQRGAELAEIVDFFDTGHFQHYWSISENITFGYPNREAYTAEALPGNAFFRAFLRETGLMKPLLEFAKETAIQTVSLLSGLQEEAFFFQGSPIPLEEFDEYSSMVDRIENVQTERLTPHDKDKLLRLALRFIPDRHKMVTFPSRLESLVLEARHLFLDRMSSVDPGAFTFYRPAEYLFTQNVLDNILFGHPRAEYPQAMDLIRQKVVDQLKEDGLLDEVMAIGLEFQVGSKGDRLSGGQKQKIAIARALLKRPRILILDEATASLDNTSQARIQQLLNSELKGRLTLVAVAHRLELVRDYDRIAVMKTGKIVEIGRYEELMAGKGLFYELVHGS